MANKKISDLTSRSPFAVGDLVEIERPSLPAGSRSGKVALTYMLLGSDIINVKDYGALGDGTTDDTANIKLAAEACFGTVASPNGTSASQNRQMYFPPGSYKVTSKIPLPRVRGGHIFGAGRFVTKIFTTSTTEPIFETNGFEYCLVEGIYLTGQVTTPRLFDLSWDNGAGPALQSNTFRDLYFEDGVIGLDIGRGGFMGSENLLLNCAWRGFSTVALRASNANALQNTVIGGNIGHCGIGIYVASGSVPLIDSVGFQDNTTDIQQDNSSSERDILNIIGCRTESPDFFWAKSNPVPATIIGCSQANASANAFVDARAGGQTLIQACVSQSGTVRAPSGRIENSRFDAASPFNTTFFTAGDNLEVVNTWINAKATYIENRRYLYRSAGLVYTYDRTDRINLFVGSGNITLAGERTVLVNKASGAATAIILGTASSRNTLPITVKDLKGDAASNNITFTVSGGELIDGLAASNFTIATNYGAITLYPILGGGGWYTLQ